MPRGRPAKTQEFKIKREDPPDVAGRKRSIDWDLRLSKLKTLIERSKDNGCSVGTNSRQYTPGLLVPMELHTTLSVRSVV